MALIALTRNYHDGEFYTQAEIDAPYDDIETFINATKLNDDNLQNAGITASLKLAAGSISTNNLGALVVTAAKVALNTLTGGTTGVGQIAVNTVTGGASGNLALTTITEANMAANSVGTAEIINANVTPAKLSFSSFPVVQNSVNIDTNVQTNEGLYFVDTSGGPVTLTLYAPSLNTIPITIKKTTDDLNTVTVTDGTFSTTLNTGAERITVEAQQAGGPAWRVINRNTRTSPAAFTPVCQGLTVSNHNIHSWRDGKWLYVNGVVAFSSSAGGAAIQIAYGGTSGPTGLTIDTTLVGTTNRLLGNYIASHAGTYIAGYMISFNDTTYVALGFNVGGGSTPPTSQSNGSSIIVLANEYISFDFKVPITGWND